jgi:uncharacterized protein (TIGR02996 family)
MSCSARNPALEAAIIADWTDERAWAVYADWLMNHGDPLGEYLSLKHALRRTDPSMRLAIEEALHAIGRERLLGPASPRCSTSLHRASSSPGATAS